VVEIVLDGLHAVALVSAMPTRPCIRVLLVRTRVAVLRASATQTGRTCLSGSVFMIAFSSESRRWVACCELPLGVKLLVLGSSS
jgi:hypothetical protein